MSAFVPAPERSVQERAADQYLSARGIQRKDWEKYGYSLIDVGIARSRTPRKPPEGVLACINTQNPAERMYQVLFVYWAIDPDTGRTTMKADKGNPADVWDYMTVPGGAAQPEFLLSVEAYSKGCAISPYLPPTFKVICKTGLDGFSKTEYLMFRTPEHPDPKVIYILNDSLPENEEKAARQLRAEKREAEALLERHPGAEVRIVRLPAPPRWFNGKDASWGVDDWLVTIGSKNGDHAAEVEALLAKAVPYSPFEIAQRPELSPAAAAIKGAIAQRPAPHPFVIEGLLPIEVGELVATGGVGKTTFCAYAAIHIAIGAPFLGHAILRPGPVVIITAEDSRATYLYRLYHIVEKLGLTPVQLELLEQNLFIEDLSGIQPRLVSEDKTGNLHFTDLPAEIISKYRDLRPSLMVFDPFMSFSPGEKSVNDGAHMTVVAGRTVMKALECAVLFVHHMDKVSARSGYVGQHAGRGGTALGDACRFEMQLERVRGDKLQDRHPLLPNTIDPAWTEAQDHAVYALHVPKLSFAPVPSVPYYVVRSDGWLFEHHPPTGETREAADAHREERNKRIICAFLRRERKLNNNIHSRTSLRSNKNLHRETGLSKHKLESFVDDMIAEGLLEQRTVEGKAFGAKKAYLFPADHAFRGVGEEAPAEDEGAEDE